jgi:N-acetylmuramoyl-L-alanine amidase
LGNKNKMLATVLMDLSQTATLDASMDLGERVLSKLGQVGELHKDKVQRAGFVVLKSPDIPSILVETAFVSNPTEARKLIQPSHQSRLAKAILGGVQNYAEQRRPDVFLAHNEKPAVVKHRIRRGETVSSIAQAYDVNPGQIRQLNRLSSDFIRVGENLQIPAPKG